MDKLNMISNVTSVSGTSSIFLIIPVIILCLLSLAVALISQYSLYSITETTGGKTGTIIGSGIVTVEHSGLKKSKYPFNPMATEYSTENAGFLCDASSQAYSDSESCHIWALDNGFDEAFFFVTSGGTGTEGFVAQNSKCILIVFRGTEFKELSDLLTDANVASKTHLGNLGTIHSGFYNAFFSIWGKIFRGFKKVNNVNVKSTPAGSGSSKIKVSFNSINENLFPTYLQKYTQHGDRKIWITGHSLGGALAYICAAQTELIDEIPIHAAYTFGQPRVGDQEFATNVNNAMGGKIFRIVNNRDLIPTFAPFSMNYRHNGNKIFYNVLKKENFEANHIESQENALSSILTSALNDNPFQYISFTPSLAFLKDTEAAVDLSRAKRNTAAGVEDHKIDTGYKSIFNSI